MWGVSNMALPDALRRFRLERRMTQAQLAQKIGVTTGAVSGWEAGRSNPTVDNIVAVCKSLEVSADGLLELQNHEKQQAPKPIFQATNEEIELLQNYRMLDEFGKRVVSALLSIELDRVSVDIGIDSANNIIPYERVVGDRYIPKFLTPAAAGYSSTIDEADFEMLLVDKNIPHGADYAVVIQGDSMNPYISDGDTVFVKRTEEVSVGEIGIFSVNGAMYCKMFYRTGSGDIWLVSTNEALESSNVLVKAGSSDSFRCLGKILLSEKPKLPDYFMQKMIP
jgi:SOS-response transcriptional repressor LexA